MISRFRDILKNPLQVTNNFLAVARKYHASDIANRDLLQPQINEQLGLFAGDVNANTQQLSDLLQCIRDAFDDFYDRLATLKQTDPSDLSLQQELNELLYDLEQLNSSIRSYINRADEVIALLRGAVHFIDSGQGIEQSIQTLQANQAALNFNKLTLNNLIRELRTKLAAVNTGRRPLDGHNPVDWDDDPTVYENTSIGLGHMLYIRQTWKNDGYSIGDVEGSVVLQPMQIKQVATIDWTRRDEAFRAEVVEAEDELDNTVTRESDIEEILNTALAEDMQGSSKSSSRSSGGSAGLAAGIGGIIGISGGFQSSKASANSSASQNSSRNLAATAMQSLKDRIQQSAASVRNQRSTVIQTVNQSESTKATTEVIANYNRRHALTTMWFSIHRHFVIEQEIADVQECLFFPMPITSFDMAKAYRWSDLLKRRLLDRQLRPAFKALERKMDNYFNIEVPENRYCDELIHYIEGEIQISFDIPRMPDPDETLLQAAIKANDVEKIEAAIEGRNALLNGGGDANPFYQAWFWLLKRKYARSQDAYLTHLADKEKAERDYHYEKEIVPVMVETLVNECLLFTLNGVVKRADFTLVDKYGDLITANLGINGNGQSKRYTTGKGKPLRIRFRIENPDIKRIDLDHLNLWLKTPQAENQGNGIRIQLRSAHIRYGTNFGSFSLYHNRNMFDDLGFNDDAMIRTSFLTDKEKQNPKKEDNIQIARLLGHLNQNLERYHAMIWMRMDNNRLFRLLDGYIAPNSGGRSVASVVESRPIGVIGNNLILKVVPGANLDPNYQINNDRGITLLDHYKPEKLMAPFRVAVKNPGLYGESILGKCESAETIDDSKLWRFEDLKIPYLPTEIQPVSTDSRYQNPGDLQAKDFAQPMINMQTLNPQSLSDSSLKDALNLLGKGDSFRDITGLAGTQDLVKNAQNQNTAVLKNATDAAQSALQTGANFALARKKQDIEAYQALSKGATPEEQKALRQAFMKSWDDSDKTFAEAMENANRINREQAAREGQNKTAENANVAQQMLQGGTKAEEITVNEDGVSLKGVTTNNEGVKAWLLDNKAEILEIAKKYDLMQAGKEGKDNVCWAYALALTLFPSHNWQAKDGTNEALVTEILAMLDAQAEGIELADEPIEEAPAEDEPDDNENA